MASESLEAIGGSPPGDEEINVAANPSRLTANNNFTGSSRLLVARENERVEGCRPS